MNWLDIVFGLVILLSVIGGLRAGLAREVIGLVALVLAVVCGLWFYGSAGALVQPYLSSKQLANALGFFMIFGGILLAGALVTWILEKLLKWVHLSWLNRLLGGVFGLARAAVISAVIVMVLMAFTSKPPPRSVVESRLAPYVVDAARVMAAAAPYELKEGFRQSYEKVREAWAEMMKKGIRGLGGQEL